MTCTGMLREEHHPDHPPATRLEGPEPADACFRDDLMPVLVVLSTGPAGRDGTDLLTGIATLARGAAALPRASPACRGVLVRFRRSTGQPGGTPRSRGNHPVGGSTRRSARDMRRIRGSGRLSLTLDLAHEILDAGETGKPAPFITNLVDLGEHLIGSGLLHTVPRHARTNSRRHRPDSRSEEGHPRAK